MTDDLVSIEPRLLRAFGSSDDATGNPTSNFSDYSFPAAPQHVRSTSGLPGLTPTVSLGPSGDVTEVTASKYEDVSYPSSTTSTARSTLVDKNTALPDFSFGRSSVDSPYPQHRHLRALTGKGLRGQDQRNMNAFSFSEYLSEGNTNTLPGYSHRLENEQLSRSLTASPLAPTSLPSVLFSTASQAPTQAQHYSGRDRDQAMHGEPLQISSREFNDYRPPSMWNAVETPSRTSYTGRPDSIAQDATQQGKTSRRACFNPYTPSTHLMVRSVSDVSFASANSGFSDDYHHSSSQFSGSEHDTNNTTACNPAHVNYSASHEYMYPSHQNDSHESIPYVYGLSLLDNRSRREEEREGREGPNHSVRYDGEFSTFKNGHPSTSHSRSNSHSSRSTRGRVSRGIFHPSPASMLAPEIAEKLAESRRSGRSGAFSTTTASVLPSDAEFARMPTKRSRGRRPPGAPDLVLAQDPNANPSEAQIRYCGVTKTGKPKKIFLCKVPGCGKCFKRSEHLKRHVRSIHTNERPFQCQWPDCAKLFSRHDNLNQHLRIHRQPRQSDASFSAQLEACFGRRMENEVAQETDSES